MRESETYRLHLEDILSFSGGRRLLSEKEVAEYLGCCRQTVAKRYGIKGKNGVLAVELASALAKKQEG